MNTSLRQKLSILGVMLSLFLTGSVSVQQIDLKLQSGYHKTEAETPTKWMPSTVPGAMQLDVMKGENYKQHWWYATMYASLISDKNTQGFF